MSIPVTLTPGVLPSGFCFTTLQDYYNTIIALTTASVSGTFNGVIIGPNLPAVGDRDKLWIKTDAYGFPIGQFLFKGQWVWPNPRQTSGQERIIWNGTELDLWSYDGGDGTDPVSTPPTATTGAMWRIDTNFAFRFPVGVSHINTATNPTAYDGNPASVINQGDVGGEERHVLVNTEEPDHKHVTGLSLTEQSNVNTLDVSFIQNAAAVKVPLAGATPVVVIDVLENPDPDGGGTITSGDMITSEKLVANDNAKSHQNMPPYIVVGFASRTARQYYVGG